MVSADGKVAVEFAGVKHYPQRVPFDPPEKYAELNVLDTDPDNKIYAGVRTLFARLGMDEGNFGTSAWSPLRDLVKPGMTVFIKPNTVRHHHTTGGDVLSVITHGSVLRPVLDYVCKALDGSGRIIIGDSQVVFGHFDEAHERARITPLLDWYRKQTNIPIECFDLRMNRGVRTWMYGRWGRVKVEQDPRGYRFVDLGERSCFKDIDPKRLRIGIASYKEMRRHHTETKHEYLFPKSVLDSDVVISIAKLKTHRRTAVTLAIKNFMGIPSLKDSLPHFITGSPEQGGDQYIHTSRRKEIATWMHDQIQSSPYVPIKFFWAVAKKMVWNSRRIVPFKDDVYEAMWYGNDTIWRTLTDIHRGVAYADREGRIQQTRQRAFLGLIDGIIAGEKDGPVGVDPVPAGVLLAGCNPVALDVVGATMMGHDIRRIPIIQKPIDMRDEPLPLFEGTTDDVRILDGDRELTVEELKKVHNLEFEPHPNWKGHVELDR